MNRVTRQTGAIDLQLLFTVLMGAFVVICLIKLAPVYVDHWTIREAFQGVQEELEPNKADKKQIRAMLERRFTVNRIEQIKTKDIQFVREKTRLLVKAPYEVRVPLLLNVDAVIKFADTGFEVPLTGD
jgi:Tfp pilus assembly protein PilO